MKVTAFFVLLACNFCCATRNPFVFVASTQRPKTTIIGRGMIHDKHMMCEAYTTPNGSIKMRLIPQSVVAKKSPST